MIIITTCVTTEKNKYNLWTNREIECTFAMHKEINTYTHMQTRKTRNIIYTAKKKKEVKRQNNNLVTRTEK